MSCGDPHETPCSEVLEAVYLYLDGEQDASTTTRSASTSTSAPRACGSSA
jgi:hypothetical protein